jgi:hypothetical protein
MSEESDLIKALQNAMETHTAEINTSAPGVLKSYDAKENRATVTPSLPKRLASGDPLPAPDLYKVPIVWPLTMGGRCGFTLPMQAGDGVKLDFAQRSLEGWLEGSNDAPDDGRQHDLSDAVATPGLQATGISADPDNAEFFFGPVRLILKPSGEGRMQTAGGHWRITPEGDVYYTGTIYVDGDAKVKGDVIAGTVSLKNHVHTLVQPGQGQSGAPKP